MDDKHEPDLRMSLDDLMGDAWDANEARMVEHLRAAIAAAPEKERFDYVTFAALYWRKTAHRDLDGTESDAVRTHYEREYYLYFPQIQTMAEYAARLEYLDSVSGN